MPEPDLLSLSSEVYNLAALLLKFFNQAMEERLQSYGVPMGGLQYGILRMLYFETLTASTLSQRMGLDPSSTVRIIDSLERKELAMRGVDPHDRRRNPIEITAKGRQLVDANPVISEKDITYQALQSLGTEQVTLLRNLLFQTILQIPDGRTIIQGAKAGGQTNPGYKE